MRECIDVLPQPIIDISQIDFHKGLTGRYNTLDTRSQRSKTSGAGWGKAKASLSKNATLKKDGRSPQNKFTTIYRKMAIICGEEDERESILDEDDNKSVRSKKSMSVYSSVAKSIRK